MNIKPRGESSNSKTEFKIDQETPKFFSIELPYSPEDENLTFTYKSSISQKVEKETFLDTLQMQVLSMFSITKVKTKEELPYIEIHKSFF